MTLLLILDGDIEVKNYYDTGLTALDLKPRTPLMQVFEKSYRTEVSVLMATVVSEAGAVQAPLHPFRDW